MYFQCILSILKCFCMIYSLLSNLSSQKYLHPRISSPSRVCVKLRVDIFNLIKQMSHLGSILCRYFHLYTYCSLQDRRGTKKKALNHKILGDYRSSSHRIHWNICACICGFLRTDMHRIAGILKMKGFEHKNLIWRSRNSSFL